MSLSLAFVSSLRSFRNNNFVKVSSVALESAIDSIALQNGHNTDDLPSEKSGVSHPLPRRVYRDAAMVSISPYLRPKGFPFCFCFFITGEMTLVL